MPTDYPQLELNVERDGPRVTVSLAGELDLASAPHLLERLLPLGRRRAGEPPAEVLLDAGRLAFIDVAGLDALIKVSAALNAAGGSLRLRRSTALLDRMLTVLRLDHRFAPRRPPA